MKSSFKREAFPSSSELIVASALLLLSSTTTPDERKRSKTLRSWNRSCVKAEKGAEASTHHHHHRSRHVDSAPDSTTRKLKAIANFVARFHQLKKMTVTRKKRTKTYWFSGGSDVYSSCKSVDDPVSPSRSGSTSIVSCVTNSSGVEFTSNVALGATKSSPKRKLDKVIHGDGSNRIGSGHIRCRAEGILKMLATCGGASEVRIREVLGDSPDTSKALRILLRRSQVQRHGAGGRGDPYTYSTGIEELTETMTGMARLIQLHEW